MNFQRKGFSWQQKSSAELLMEHSQILWGSQHPRLSPFLSAVPIKNAARWEAKSPELSLKLVYAYFRRHNIFLVQKFQRQTKSPDLISTGFS